MFSLNETKTLQLSAGKKKEPRTDQTDYQTDSAYPFQLATQDRKDIPFSFSHHRVTRPTTPHLAGVGSDLDVRTLSTLLGGDTALGVGGVLGLLSLLGGLRLLLLGLGLLDGGETGGRAGLGAHGAALLDHIEGSTDDGTLGLDGTAGALLGNLL